MTMPSTSTESTTDSSTTEIEVPQNSAEDLGYDEPISAPAEPAAAIPPVTPPATEVKVEKSVTGYGEEPAAAPATPPATEVIVEKKPEEMNDEEKAAKAISDEVSTLGDGYNKDKIKKFVADNKLTPDQVKAYVAQVKADDAADLKANTERVQAQRKLWNEELVADVDFGGQNFAKSVHEVESLMEKYFPDTKKVLTEKKGMLPPYFMKDLLKVAKALKPTNKFEGGEPPAPTEDTSSFLDDMYG